MPDPKRSNYRRKPQPAAPKQDEYGHLQPQAPELEKAVLGALMIEQDAYSLVCEELKPESFYEHRNQLVYEAIRELANEQRPVDMLTVTEQLRRNGTLEEAGGPYYITELTTSVTSSAHIEYHARIIAQKYLARQLISFASVIETRAFDATQDVADLMQDAESELFKLSQHNLTQDYSRLEPVVVESYEALQKAARNVDTNGITGIPSGYSRLDHITSGWQNSDLIIIAARPAMGKTAFALSMAKNMTVDYNVPVAFFSLEMSKKQLADRLISNVCEIPSDRIRNGQLEDYQWIQLDKRIKQLYGAPLFLDDTASLSIFELRTKARRLVREEHVRCIIIDYLQLMNASGTSFGSRQEEVSNISRSLKGLAKELNIPIIVLSQVNRDVEKRAPDGQDSHRPQLSDLRESGAIEQDADLVLFIHRPEYYRILRDSHGKDMKGMAQIIIAKHRNGLTDDVTLKFKGTYARFENDDSDSPMEIEASGIPSRINGGDVPDSAVDTGGGDAGMFAPAGGDAPF